MSESYRFADEYVYNLAWYALALQVRDYRAACREALRAIRRCRRDAQPCSVWEWRARETFRRRHSDKIAA